MKIIYYLVIFSILPLALFSQNRYDIVIDEIMADPAPQVGLPNNEWIELRNTSSAAVNLQNWRFADASGQTGPMPAYILKPDSCVILCTGSAVTAMSAFGPTIQVTSFPSLDNDGDLIFLKAPNGKIIHAVNYSSSWYGNEVKKEGGWTLEMIDTKNPCGGQDNWRASVNVAGGTPGKKNSVDGINTDVSPPSLQSAYAIDSITIVLVFNEPLDSLSAATVANYTIDQGLTVQSAVALQPLFNETRLTINSPLSANTTYVITANNVMDCKSNFIAANNNARVGLPVDAIAGDWIINELLFNPRPNAFDYVEFYNNSNKILNAADLYIANRNSSGGTSSVKALSVSPRYIFPGEYIVVTEDSGSLSANYWVKEPSSIITLSPMPSFPDDEGDVITLNKQGTIIDEVKYNSDWHFKLISDPEGVSLERISPAGPSQDANNWHSAASTAGYGTPGYANSQYQQSAGILTKIAVRPAVFSPDNDGRDDIVTIQYQMSERGYMANIIVFDASGRALRRLVNNGLLGLTGSWTWDGLDDKGMKLPVGIYIVLTEIFNLQGKKQRFKDTVVLARKLN